MDQASHDPDRLRMEQEARVHDLSHEVRRLVESDLDEAQPEPSDLQARRYDLADGSSLDVQFQDHPDDNVGYQRFAIQRSFAPQDIKGPDGVTRRVTPMRRYDLEEHGGDPYDMIVPDYWPISHDAPELSQAVKDRSMERAVFGDYQPPEIIDAQTVTRVERPLPNSPNYREERLQPSMPEETRAAFNETVSMAQMYADIPPRDTPYSPKEHDTLMETLRGIDPVKTPPQETDSLF